MGQYYIAVFLDEKNNVKGCVRSWTYACGSKLGEHAYHGNPFVTAVELELSPGGRFHKSRVAWAGDYADNEPETLENLYARCDDIEIEDPLEPPVHKLSRRFLLNHSKKLGVDMQAPGPYHPLPLLTAEGNGRGGGDVTDLLPADMQLIGTWARDVLSVESELPEHFGVLKFSTRVLQF